MKLTNKTSISNELIKSILIDAGYNLSVESYLTISYSSDLKGIAHSDNAGTCSASNEDTGLHINIELLSWASTEVLAHELRHAYQIQTMGISTFNGIYETESEVEGYVNNILELDACEFALRWKV